MACDVYIHQNKSSLEKTIKLLSYWSQKYKVKQNKRYYIKTNDIHKIVNAAQYNYNSANIRKAASIVLLQIVDDKQKLILNYLKQDLMIDELKAQKINLNSFFYNTDYLRNYAEGLLSYIIFHKTNDMPHFKQYLENFLTPTLGYRDGLKPDGLGFHHKMHYNAYMTAYNPLIDILSFLNNTSYQISKEKYLFFQKSIYTMSLMCMNTEELPSIGGRHPFYTHFPISKNRIKKLINTGGSILNTKVDYTLASMHHRLWKEKKYQQHFDQELSKGFFQFNYGALGLYREDNWLAGIHGFNYALKGGEIDPLSSGKNMYGRYQTYGTIEILYEGGKKTSGFPYQKPIRNKKDSSLNMSDSAQMGWDWNKWPGTTSILLPWHKLLAQPKTYKHTIEENLKKFAGALRFKDGNVGMFAMDFQQSENYQLYHTKSFTFKKSVFAFDKMIVTLGSDINNDDNMNNTITTLFQNQLINKNDPIIQSNIGKITHFPYLHTIKKSDDTWLIDTCKTGYLIRSKNKIIITKEKQKSPNRIDTKANLKNMTTGNYASAWIDHGEAPKYATYHYLIVPNATSQKMNNLKNNSNYNILQQDHIAHIIKTDKNVTCYALFKSNNNIKHGILHSTDKPILAIIKEKKQQLALSIVNPDIGYNYREKLDVIPPQMINITLKGKWNIVKSSIKIQSIKQTINFTTLQFLTKDGLPIDIQLNLMAQ